MSTASRQAILARISAALRDAAPPDQTPLARTYERSGTLQGAALIDAFAERVTEYKAVVRRCTAAALQATLTDACAARGVRRLVVPLDLPAAWMPSGVELLRDTPLSNAELDASDGVLTGCAIGIAQTGTIVLDGGAAQGRRAITLLPDYHLCVIGEDQIVGLVPEAFARLGPAVREHRRPLTFISGPSATSDIELQRVEGVHGPRTLELVIVGA